MSSPSARHILDLPADVLGQVFCRLPLSCIASVARVCREWHQTVQDDGFWRMVLLTQFSSFVDGIDELLSQRTSALSLLQDLLVSTYQYWSRNEFRFRPVLDEAPSWCLAMNDEQTFISEHSGKVSWFPSALLHSTAALARSKATARIRADEGFRSVTMPDSVYAMEANNSVLVAGCQHGPTWLMDVRTGTVLLKTALNGDAYGVGLTSSHFAANNFDDGSVVVYDIHTGQPTWQCGSSKDHGQVGLHLTENKVYAGNQSHFHVFDMRTGTDPVLTVSTPSYAFVVKPRDEYRIAVAVWDSWVMDVDQRMVASGSGQSKCTVKYADCSLVQLPDTSPRGLVANREVTIVGAQTTIAAYRDMDPTSQVTHRVSDPLGNVSGLMAQRGLVLLSTERHGLVQVLVERDADD